MAEHDDSPNPRTPSQPPRRAAKRLLVASIGVATLHYTGACKESFGHSVSNLMAFPTPPSVTPTTGQGMFGATAQGAPLPPLPLPVPPATVVPVGGNAAPVTDADAGSDTDAGSSRAR